ncbi:MAG: class I SAM-dependent methyltransferase [Patescibacteria group bacterium]|nr:class I SAM-dependent methyltransferase [Patescibacteria group bacterium]
MFETPRREEIVPKVVREASRFSVVDKALQERAEWMREEAKVLKYLRPKIEWKDPENITAGAEKGVDVLCIGAGKGHEMDELDQVLPRSNIMGCDPHDHYTKPVKERLETLAHDSRYLPENVTATNLEGVENESLDAVTMFFVLHHMDEKEHDAAFAELRRVLKSDGYAFVAEDLVDNEDERKVTEKIDRKLNLQLSEDLPHNYRNTERWEKFFEKHGMEVVEVNEVKPDKVRHGFFVLKKKLPEVEGAS